MSQPDRTPSAASPRDEFADDVLERLIRSNGDYQREHGHYIVPLARRLLVLRGVLAEADVLVSKAHDIVWAAYPEWEGEEGRREPLNKAMWDLHALLRAVIGGDDGIS